MKPTTAPKRLAALLATALVCLHASSCSRPVVAGSGTRAVDERGFSGYTMVEASGANLKLVLRTGPTELVRVSGDDNLVPLVETSLAGGTLSVGTGAKVLRPKEPLVVEITARRLQRVALSGAVDAEILDYTDKRLEVKLTGVGELRATGATESLLVTINGAGDLDALGLVTQDAEVTVLGAGDAQVHVTGKLVAKVTGAGDIRYRGAPQVQQAVTGVGKVTPLDGADGGSDG